MMAILTASRTIFSGSRQIISNEGDFLKIIVDSKENISKTVADMMAERLTLKPESVLSFTADESLTPIFSELCGRNCCENAVFFNLCDYVVPKADSEETSLHLLRSSLFSKLGITHVHSPDPAKPDEYDELIAEHGGIDIVLLGMGLNGCIGFNEPFTPYDSRTHIAMLTEVTRRAGAERFGSFENVPNFGVTMGLKTICESKTAILAAFGSEKADIVHKLVYGKTMTDVPAAMLQMHRDMILCLDEEAAAKI